MKRFTGSLLMVLVCAASLWAQDRGRLGLGYDEGLAVRYFFNDQMGLQAAMGLEILGESDLAGASNQYSAADVSLSAGLVYNFLRSEYVNLDGLAQLAFRHDDQRDPSDVGDRDYVFLRVAGAPEIFIGRHFGLGMRFGVELASMSGTKVRAGGVVSEVDDGEIDFRFFAPQNPFDGATLGMALYVYF